MSNLLPVLYRTLMILLSSAHLDNTGAFPVSRSLAQSHPQSIPRPFLNCCAGCRYIVAFTNSLFLVRSHLHVPRWDLISWMSWYSRHIISWGSLALWGWAAGCREGRDQNDSKSLPGRCGCNFASLPVGFGQSPALTSFIFLGSLALANWQEELGSTGVKRASSGNAVPIICSFLRQRLRFCEDSAWGPNRHDLSNLTERGHSASLLGMALLAGHFRRAALKATPLLYPAHSKVLPRWSLPNWNPRLLPWGLLGATIHSQVYIKNNLCPPLI
jgi:hypothetical protein